MTSREIKQAPVNNGDLFEIFLDLIYSCLQYISNPLQILYSTNYFY